MIISCPSCSAKYLVNIEDIGFGRQVKCTRCNHSWFHENKNYENDKKLQIEEIVNTYAERDHSKDQNLPVVYEKNKTSIPLPFLLLLIPVIFISIDAVIQNSSVNAFELSRSINSYIDYILEQIRSFFSY